MNINIDNTDDKKSRAARMMHIIQKLMMGEEVSIVISPDIPLNEIDEIQKLLMKQNMPSRNTSPGKCGRR